MSGAIPGSTVLVTGASSQIGVFLLPRLLESGFRVRAFSRAVTGELEAPGDRLQWVSPDSGPEKSPDARGLVSAGPLEVALRLIDRSPALRNAIVFTTTSILSKQQSPDAAERALMEQLLGQELELKNLCRARSISLVLIRPTLIYGCGLDRNISRLLRLGERFGLIPLSSRADGMRQPVHADDLAALAVAALQAETGALLEGPACGGETLAYREMVARVAACGQRRIRLLGLAPSVLATGIKVISALGLDEGINPQMVYRQSVNLVFDDGRFRDMLDYAPRSFNPTQDDFRIPPDLARLRPFIPM